MKTVAPALFYLILFLSVACCEDIGGDFDYDRHDADCPLVTGLFPDLARFDEIVEVRGANFFSRDPQQYEVYIDGKLIDRSRIVEVLNDSTLRFRVPEKAGSGQVQIKLPYLACNGSTSDGPSFTYQYTVGSSVIFAGDSASTECTDCLHGPRGLEVDPEGDLWVADYTHNVVREIRPNGDRGTIIRTIGQRNTLPECTCVNAPNSIDEAVCFFFPSDLALGQGDDVFVIESESEKQLISRISKNKDGGCFLYAGNCDGTPGDCTGQLDLVFPSSIAWDNIGKTHYIVDNSRITTIAQGCNTSTLPFPDGQNQLAVAIDINPSRSDNQPTVLYWNATDQLYRLARIESDKNLAPVPMINSPFLMPVALTSDKKGNFFLVDRDANQVFIVYANGQVLPLFDGASSPLNAPAGIVLDENADDGSILYLSDTGNNIIRAFFLK